MWNGHNIGGHKWTIYLERKVFEECNIFFSVFPVLEDKVYNLRNLYDKNNIVFVSVSESFWPNSLDTGHLIDSQQMCAEIVLPKK